MCMATPVTPVAPSNPAPYSLADSWKEATSNTVSSDGKTTGGDTIGNVMKQQQTSGTTAKGTGANISM